ncbi:hypothetical protein IKI14_00245 [bacterium]|nr:hypothetical protein [bacterium]
MANSKSVILLSEGNANKVTNRMNGSPSHDAQSKIVTSMAGFSTFL